MIFIISFVQRFTITEPSTSKTTPDSSAFTKNQSHCPPDGHGDAVDTVMTNWMTIILIVMMTIEMMMC